MVPAQVLEGKPGLAIQTFTEAIDLFAQEQVGLFRFLQLWAQLAGAHLLCGNLDEARAAAERAVERSQGGVVIEPCITLARVLRVSEGAAAADEIEAQLQRAKAAIERYGYALLTPFLSEESAHFARLLGDEEGCERHLREAHRLYTEMGAVGHAERVERELAAAKRREVP